jgi:quercetin 2,3-dioxygenase
MSATTSSTSSFPPGAHARRVGRLINATSRGAARIGSDAREVREGQAALLAPGDSVSLDVPADAGGHAEILLLSGRPLQEPVARHGPFVMNTREQIEAAFRDYQEGRFGLIPQRG